MQWNQCGARAKPPPQSDQLTSASSNPLQARSARKRTGSSRKSFSSTNDDQALDIKGFFFLGCILHSKSFHRRHKAQIFGTTTKNAPAIQGRQAILSHCHQNFDITLHYWITDDTASIPMHSGESGKPPGESYKLETPLYIMNYPQDSAMSGISSRSKRLNDSSFHKYSSRLSL